VTICKMIDRQLLENLKSKEISVMLNIPRGRYGTGNETYTGYIQTESNQ